MWTQETTTFEGRHFQLKEARCEPKPVQDHLPLVIGGSGERRILPLVAREADEWNCHGLDPDEYEAKAAKLAELCAEIGRDASTIKRSLMAGYLVGRDDEDLLRRARSFRDFHPRFRDLEPAAIVEATRERGWFVGLPEQLVDQMRPYIERGVQRFMLQHFLMDDEPALEILAEYVVPALREPASV
jgi:alkanesulfonate monooxygenase SsuD/methylene tetrahydromethanopterin reductase-like flavin-dependent oxidoreductase (luciferase family)